MIYARQEWLSGRVPNGFWDERENRIRYLDWLGLQCGYETNEDWYNVKFSDFRKLRGRGLMKTRYRDSVLEALKDYRPQYKWQPWRLSRVPQGFWNSRDNRYQYMTWLGKELGFRNDDDWYRVNCSDFIDNFGSGLLRRFQDSVLAILRDFRPKQDWKPWRFSVAPNSYWDSLSNRKAYFRWLGTELGFSHQNDWYRLTKQIVHQHLGGGMLMKHYGDSVLAAVSDVMPQRKWLPWRFANVPQCYWQSAENRRRYMDWLGNRLSFKSMDDWYSVTTRDFRENHGGGLLNMYYGDSRLSALRDVYKEHNWYPWLFGRMKGRNWSELKNRTDYFGWLATELKIESIDQFQDLEQSDIVNNHGESLLQYYSEQNKGLRKPKRDGSVWTGILKAEKRRSSNPFLTGISNQINS